MGLSSVHNISQTAAIECGTDAYQSHCQTARNITFSFSVHFQCTCNRFHCNNCELSDDEVITKRRNNFMCQVFNTLSYFRPFDTSMQHKLFQSYSTDYYGCELHGHRAARNKTIYVLLGERAYGKFGNSLNSCITICCIH